MSAPKEVTEAIETRLSGKGPVGTFVLVWAVHNWQIVTVLFNSATNEKLPLSNAEAKIAEVSNLIQSGGMWGLLVVPLFWTTVILAVGLGVDYIWHAITEWQNREKAKVSLRTSVECEAIRRFGNDGKRMTEDLVTLLGDWHQKARQIEEQTANPTKGQIDSYALRLSECGKIAYFMSDSMGKLSSLWYSAGIEGFKKDSPDTPQKTSS